MITEQRVRDLVDHFCNEEGIKNYSVTFNNSKATLGQCQHDYAHYDYLGGAYDYTKSRFTFKFSKFWMENTSFEEFLDTILHEIAHAVAGYKAQHGYEWKKVARRMGCNPRASARVDVSEDVKESMYKWRGVCPSGHTTYSNRLTAQGRRKSCGQCRPVYDPNYMFDWEQLR